MNDELVTVYEDGIATAKVGDGHLLVQSIAYPVDDWRTQYRWEVWSQDSLIESGTDLFTGSRSDDGPVDMIATLCSFLCACAESGADGENGDLFNSAVLEWAVANSDELSMLGIEIEEAQS